MGLSCGCGEVPSWSGSSFRRLMNHRPAVPGGVRNKLMQIALAPACTALPYPALRCSSVAGCMSTTTQTPVHRSRANPRHVASPLFRRELVGPSRRLLTSLVALSSFMTFFCLVRMSAMLDLRQDSDEFEPPQRRLRRSRPPHASPNRNARHRRRRRRERSTRAEPARTPPTDWPLPGRSVQSHVSRMRPHSLSTSRFLGRLPQTGTHAGSAASLRHLFAGRAKTPR